MKAANSAVRKKVGRMKSSESHRQRARSAKKKPKQRIHTLNSKKKPQTLRPIRKTKTSAKKQKRAMSAKTKTAAISADRKKTLPVTLRTPSVPWLPERHQRLRPPVNTRKPRSSATARIYPFPESIQQVPPEPFTFTTEAPVKDIAAPQENVAEERIGATYHFFTEPIDMNDIKVMGEPWSQIMNTIPKDYMIPDMDFLSVLMDGLQSQPEEETIQPTDFSLTTEYTDDGEAIAENPFETESAYDWQDDQAATVDL